MGFIITIILLIAVLNVVFDWMDLIYRIITENDVEHSWKERAITDFLHGLIWLIILLGLILGW